MDMSNRDHLRRREEDDDDLFLFILPSLHLLGYLGRSKKKLRHTSALTGEEKVVFREQHGILNWRRASLICCLSTMYLHIGLKMAGVQMLGTKL